MEKLGGQAIISAMDLAGHGKSGGHRAYISEFDNFSKDWLSFLNICHERFYNKDEYEVETIIISHSLGGLVVLNTLTNQEYEIPFPISKLIFSNPCIAPSIELPGAIKRAVTKFPLAASKLRLPLIYGAYDLTHDNERAIAFIKDPLISKAVTVKVGIEILKACDKLIGHSYFFQHKSFFLLSGQDKIVDNSKADIFISGMDKSLVQLKKYPKMYHDLLNETCRTEVFDEIIKYIKKK
jgi:lysophospholipase